VSEIVHVAGPLITYDNVQRQRCAWCGGLIEERDLERTAVAIEPGESAEHAAEGLRRTKWAGLVAVDGNVRWAVDEPDDGKAPERSCMRLLPSGDES
jgi:hypothetical protein